MSKLPTLLVKGNLKAYNGDAALQKQLDEYVPMEYIIEWIKRREPNVGALNRVLVLKAQVASGKSTALVASLYIEFLHGKRGAGLICSQPRVLTAIKNVISISKEQSYASYLKLGTTIGWSTGSNKLLVPKYGVLSCTIGTLAMILKTHTDAEIANRFKFIIVDEFHERDLETDFTVMVLKQYMDRNANNVVVPFIILMSATFEQKQVLDFFNVPESSNFIFVQGFSHPTTEVWKYTTPVPSFTRAAVEVVEEIVHKFKTDEPEKGDVLVFMPGSKEILDVVKGLNGVNKKLLNEKIPPMCIIILDSDVINNDKPDARKLITPLADIVIEIDGKPIKERANRRVIIGTNVAETGVTIDSLRYLVDSGLHRGIEFYPAYGISTLITKPANRSRIIQRRGRVGRKQAGTFYPLYTKELYDKLVPQQFPNILLDDISPIILAIILKQIEKKEYELGDPLGSGTGYFDVRELVMIDMPSVDALSAVIQKLYSIGLLTITTGAATQAQAQTPIPRYVLTKLGSLCALFMKMTPEALRMIFAGYFWGSSILDLIGIASYLSVREGELALDGKKGVLWSEVYKTGLPDFFKQDENLDRNLYKVRLMVADDFIDGAILFAAIKNRFTISRHADNILVDFEAWCVAANLSFPAVLNLIAVRNELIDQMITNKVNIVKNEQFALATTSALTFEDRVSRLKYCIYEGYRCNVMNYSTTDNKYHIAAGNLAVAAPKLFRKNEGALFKSMEFGVLLDVKPRTVVFSKLSMRYNQKAGEFEVSAEKISALDGYVAIDKAFN